MICWWRRLQWRVPNTTMFFGVPCWMLSSCFRIVSNPERSVPSITPASGVRVAVSEPTPAGCLSVNISGRSSARLGTSPAGSASEALTHMLECHLRLSQNTTPEFPLLPLRIAVAVGVPSCTRRAEAQTACCNTTAHRQARISGRVQIALAMLAIGWAENTKLHILR